MEIGRSSHTDEVHSSAGFHTSVLESNHDTFIYYFFEQIDVTNDPKSSQQDTSMKKSDISVLRSNQSSLSLRKVDMIND